MAGIKPFRGIRYNPDRITDMANVVCPPYDIITENEQSALHDRSPYNVIRMELGQKHPADDSTDNPHTRAGHYLNTWLKKGVLIQEKTPALYLAATEFETEHGPCTRWGLVVSVALEPFHQGGIRPHERTYSKVKLERLSLMHACRANLSPIFSFFSDKHDTIPQIKTQMTPLRPVADFRDNTHHRHRLWVIQDPNLLALVTANLAHEPIFIADGHHRYETALAYRDELAASPEGLSEDHPANYTLMYLSSIQDPGLKILPAHRLLPKVDPEIRRRFVESLDPLFNVKPFEVNGKQDKRFKDLMNRLDATPPGEGLVVVLQNIPTPLLIQLKPGIKNRLYASDLPDMIKGIDVTLLSDFIFPKILGISRSQMDDVNRVHYHHDAYEALESVTRGQYEMAFIIKPTPILAVQRVADAGLVMPRKSTYFAPKVITGLVMHGLYATA